MKKESINFKEVLEHPDCQKAVSLIDLKGKGASVYGGAVRDYVLFKLGKSVTFQPNDFDFLVPQTPDEFQEHLENLVEKGHLLPPKEGKDPYFRMTYVPAFRVYWLEEETQIIKHIDVKCIGDKSVESILKGSSLNIDGMAVTELGEFIDPCDGFSGIQDKVVRFNNTDPEHLKKDPYNVFRYYTGCDSIGAPANLNPDIVRVTAPYLADKEFFNLNSRISTVLNRKNGAKVLKQIIKDGILDCLPFEEPLGTDVVEQVFFLENALSLNKVSSARVFGAFHGNKMATQKSAARKNLETRYKWEDRTENRQYKREKMPEKHNEKMAILNLTEEIDTDPNKIFDLLLKDGWNSMDSKDQLCTLLLSNTVYKAFQQNDEDAIDIQESVRGYLDLIRRDKNATPFFK